MCASTQFFANAFYVFMLRQFFSTIPRDLDDAARIDGCGILGLFWRIILPLSMPAVGIVAIFEFTNSWNWFLGPLIYLSRMETFPLALALSYLKDDLPRALVRNDGGFVYFHDSAFGALLRCSENLYSRNRCYGRQGVAS